MAAERQQYNLAVVKEFYINTDDLSIRKNSWAHIRGKLVTFTKEKINEYYGILAADCPNYTFAWSNEVQVMPERMLLQELFCPDHTADAEI